MYLEVIIEVGKLYDDIAGNDRKRKVNLKTKYTHYHSDTHKKKKY